MRSSSSLDGLLDSLSREPRIILLSVPAGQAVDNALSELKGRLDPGDIVIDSGNSHFEDTERRTAELAAARIRFAGIGVSGGEEGARHGPSIMAGGEASAFGELAPVLASIAARFDNEPCCAWMGPGGAGHFVKMIHNGIEYADMQLIAESWLLMRDAMGMDAEAASRVFSEWNRGRARFLSHRDHGRNPCHDGPVDGTSGGRCDRRSRRAEGYRAVGIALDPETRRSGTDDHRRRQRPEHSLPPVRGVRRWPISRAPRPSGTAAGFAGAQAAAPDILGKALLCARIAAYAQGFMILDAARGEHGWPLDFERIAAIWRAGCIIRARLLGPIMQAAATGLGPAGLLAASPTREMVEESLPALRAAVLAGTAHGVPLPAFTSALGWLDGFGTGNVGASLIQAQRDRFGAHGFERVDLPGSHHLDPDHG